MGPDSDTTAVVSVDRSIATQLLNLKGVIVKKFALMFLAMSLVLPVVGCGDSGPDPMPAPGEPDPATEDLDDLDPGEPGDPVDNA